MNTETRTPPPPPLPERKQRLTSTCLNLLRRCPAAYEKRYEQLLERDAEIHYFRMGNSWHWAHELKAGGLGAPLVLEAVRDTYDPRQPVERETIIALLTGYWHYWQNDPLDVIMPELQFEIPLVNPATGSSSRLFNLAGKMDGIVKFPDVMVGGTRHAVDRLAVLEYKTTSEDISPDSQYWLRLRIDPQISQYYLAARQLDIDVQTVLYDVCRKPTISPKQIPSLDEEGRKKVFDADGHRVFNKTKGEPDPTKPRQSADKAQGYELETREETPDEFGVRLLDDIYDRPEFYYARREIPRLSDDLEVFQRELWHHAKELRLRQLNGWWGRTVSRFTCMGCAYADLCLQSISVERDGPPPAGFVRLDSAYPELDGEIPDMIETCARV